VGSGQEIKETNALGDYQTWTYGGSYNEGYFSLLTGHRDLGGAAYTYNYNSETRLLGSQSSTLGQQIAYAYDAAR